MTEHRQLNSVSDSNAKTDTESNTPIHDEVVILRQRVVQLEQELKELRQINANLQAGSQAVCSNFSQNT